ncbi:hypothetical protein [Aurantiacibacter zhengii]|uniref:ATPase n=1 Tax=Aurantiacibacter zhengii TaxID=2307003 RepID=A0A418NVX3_9SPHN|nr:hypothetical protein [Aurantiacibacter zhengii]RIV88769.1 hypothetical protein D2V07_00370 [Aurantiacibacter zhengii]
MTRRHNLVSEQDDSARDVPDDTHVADTYDTSDQEVYEEQYWEEEPTRAKATWIVPAVVIMAALGWTAFFGWVHQREMISGATPAQWIDWIVQWSVPLVLLSALYIIAMRNSRREANRFTDAARALSEESARLESRLLVVNRELALARDFIESQSRDLESLGRVAAERLSTNADHLQGLIRDNSTQIDNIGHVSDSAVANMERLRDQLPVLTNAARDMNNQVGNAGNSAQQQVDGLLASFERLNDLHHTGEAHVAKIGEKVEATLTAFEEQIAALGDLTAQRFDRLRASTDEFRKQLDGSEERVFDAIAARSEALARQLQDDAEALQEREAAATASMRDRLASLRVEGEKLVEGLEGGQSTAIKRWSDSITALEDRMKQVLEGIIKLDETAMTNARMRLVALNDEAGKVDQGLADAMNAFQQDFEQRREANAAAQQETLAALEARIAEFDQRVQERQEEHLAHVAGLAERGEALAGRLSSLDTDMVRLGSTADDTHGRVAEAADILSDRLSQSRAVLEESNAFITRLTDDSVRLLEIVRSTTHHSQGPLSDAVANAESRLSSFDSSARELHGLIEEAENRGGRLAEQLDQARQTGTASVEQLGEMERQLAKVGSEADKLAERTSKELREAIDMLSAASAEVLENLRGEQTNAVADLAEKIAEASREQLADAMRRHAEETIAELEKATTRADDAGRKTAQELREQLAKVNELAGNLEARVQYARDRAEEQTNSDFTRRMALITEALNSSSIDIAKAFDNDVGDTQWAHYLRGDRGIFTRRAVKLLDKHEARQINGVYAEDAEFRETVNRYIHDFEAMLRGILSTRDGNALAVTLLSSDMGKLYVALAQAIDRLRD